MSRKTYSLRNERISISLPEKKLGKASSQTFLATSFLSRVRHINFFFAPELIRPLNTTSDSVQDDNATLLVEVDDSESSLNGTELLSGNLTMTAAVAAPVKWVRPVEPQ